MWSMINKRKKYVIITGIVLSLLAVTAAPSVAGMDSYCSTPPFVAMGMTPNLMMMLDNSASMYDLMYPDKGAVKDYCSINMTKKCAGADSTPCEPADGICVTETRYSAYCYDQTYNSLNKYSGYFDYKNASGDDLTKTTYYAYDFTNEYFFRTLNFPASSECTEYIANVLCVHTTAGRSVDKFVANGNYLNWITGSKFDVQKKILTGGKYVDKLCLDPIEGLTDQSCGTDADCRSGRTCTSVGQQLCLNTTTNTLTAQTCITDADCPADHTCTSVTFLQAESRGCVGRTFIKEPLSSNSGNYIEQTGANTGLGITFGVKGAPNPYNPMAPSSGGQTYIDIFKGNFNAEECQEAVDAFIRGQSPADIKKAVEDCLSYSTTMSTCVQPEADGSSRNCSKDSECDNSDGVCDILPSVCSDFVTRICTQDADCVLSDGNCAVGSKVCSLNTTRTCSDDNGCKNDDGVCSKTTKKCTNSGVKFGLTCNNDKDCDTTDGTCITPNPTCTSGNIGAACGTDSDCNTNYGLCITPGSMCIAPTPAVNLGKPCTSHAACNTNIGPCQTGAGDEATKQKVVFEQSIQTCWSFDNDGSISQGDLSRTKNHCESVYSSLSPSAILPTNPAYACSSKYIGACYDELTGLWGDDNACTIPKYKLFCLDITMPPVVDPTDAPSETSNYDNLPAMLGDIGIESQLGRPYKSLKVRVKKDSEPTGLIQNFDGKIRMGAMAFNYNGSKTECELISAGTVVAGDIVCPKVCSTDRLLTCGSEMDCPDNSDCVAVTDTENKDGARILYYIGEGYCYDQFGVKTNTKCWTDEHCASGQTCVADGAGKHGTVGSLTRQIDDIKGSDWTPFAEGFYDAIGYFAKDPADGRKSDPSGSFHINSTDYDKNKNPSQYYCQNNNILLISDGMSTADQHPKLMSIINQYAASGAGSYVECPKYKGSSSLDSLAWIAYNKKINDTALATGSTALQTKNNERINTWVVMSGPSNGEPSVDCNSEYLLSDTARKGGSSGLEKAEDPEKLETALKKTLEAIANKAASGSAVSVLTTSSRGVGSMLQAYFLPTIEDNYNTIRWIGYTQNIWIDPKDDLREDTNPDAALILDDDKVMRLYFDSVSGETKAALFTTDANGSGGTLEQCAGYEVKPFQDVIPIWEGGKKLATRSAEEPWSSVSPHDRRHIFSAAWSDTETYGFKTKFGKEFTTANMGDAGIDVFRNAMNPDPAGGIFTADKIIRYTRGKALEGADNTTGDADKFRKRLLTVDGEPNNVWKLGDVINSTPKVVGNIPQNTYYIDYGDTSYYQFISSDAYKERTSIALIGSNDGMLHAFRVGYLKDKNFQANDISSNVKAFFRNVFGGSDDVISTAASHDHLGEEVWAYIPYNILPYLRYYASEEYGKTCHIYSVDLSVKIYDASIGPVVSEDAATPDPTDALGAKSKDTWRTILIGGMRLGASCSAGTGDLPSGPPNTPLEVIGDGIGNENGVCDANENCGPGLSSFFALDITDPEKPIPLWEFADTHLGYTTSAPAIVRTGAKETNGYWYIVFGSGPTQLAGSRDIARSKTGYLYIRDLYTGKHVQKISLSHNALVGDILAIDKEKDYHSEKIYFGTSSCSTYLPTSDGKKCTSGWIGRIFSVGIPTTVTDLTTWTPSVKMLYSGNAPFTASPDAAKDEKGNVWVYAGTGKFYSKIDQDDTSQQVFLGFIDNNAAVTASTSGCPSVCPAASLCDVTDCKTEGIVPTTGGTIEACVFDNIEGSATKDTFQKRTIVTAITPLSTAPVSRIGWIRRLPTGHKSISRPLAAGGVVDFLTYKPSSDKCEHGGDSYLFAVDYTTGVAPSNVAIRALGNAVGSDGNVKTEGEVVIPEKVLLGPGAPPTGEAIIITPPKEGKEQLKKKIQVATGVIVEAENKPMISTVSKIIHWLSK